MPRTLLLVILLFGLATSSSWAQDPIASPAVTPPAPPAAETVVSPAVSISIPISSEAAKLIVQLEDERVKLLQNLGDKHPKIEELDARLAQARSQITLNPEPPEADSKESLQKEMEQAIGYLEMVTGSDSSRYNEVNAKMAEILARYDQTPAQAKIEGLKLISQVEAEALPPLEAGLEKLKSRRSVQSPESLKDYETHLAYWTVRVAKLKVRVIAQLRKDYDAADAEALRLAEQLRQPGSTASKDELRKTVGRAFKLRQSLLRAELSEMLDRLAKTQHSIDLRDRITDQIVTRRVEELLNPQLEWDESKSGTQPVAPSAPPKQSAPTQPQEWTAKLQGHWQFTQFEFKKVDTSDGKKPQPGDIKRENWNPETYYRKKSTPMKAMFDGSRMSVCGEDGSNPMTFELKFRNAGPPQQVDLTPVLNEVQIAEFKRMAEESQGPTEIPAFKWIIEETSDGFRMCTDSLGDGNRPFLFVLGPDTGIWEFRREAAAQPKQPQEQAADLEVLPDLSPQPTESKTADSEPGKTNPSHITPQQLTSLYQEILRRDPTKKEEETWINFARSRSAIPTLIAILVTQESVFDRVRRDQQRYVVLLHELLLDRKPTAEELRYWTLRFEKLHGKRTDLVSEFLASLGGSRAEDLLNRLALIDESTAAPAASKDIKPFSQIQKGMRINTFPVTDSQTHSGMLRPGDRVDVKVTLTNPKGAVEAMTLLEYVEVFACEVKTIQDADGQQVNRSRFVTLLVTPDQDGYVEFAKSKGKLFLSLRNPDDDQLVNANGIDAEVLEKLKHAIAPADDSAAIPTNETATELEGDWHLDLEHEGNRNNNNPRNLTIHGDKYSIYCPGETDPTTMRIVVDSINHKLQLIYQERPKVGPQVFTYTLDGDRLKFRSLNTSHVFVWLKGHRPFPKEDELDGDWHLVWMSKDHLRTRSPVNMSIQAGKCRFLAEKREFNPSIRVDAQTKTVRWPDGQWDPELTPVPTGGTGKYELDGDRLTIRGKADEETYVWARGLCDLQTTYRAPDGMVLSSIFVDGAATGLGQLLPGDKVNVTAAWQKADGTPQNGIVIEAVEVTDTLILSPGDDVGKSLNGSIQPGSFVVLQMSLEQARLIEQAVLRSTLSVAARQPGDDSLQYPHGLNSAVLIEMKTAAGADPVTPIEGEWYLESEEVDGDTTGQRMNLIVRGDEWTLEFLATKDTPHWLKDSGQLIIDKNAQTYRMPEWPRNGSPRVVQVVEKYPRGRYGKFELVGDKLILKGRDHIENVNYTTTWKKGRRPFTPRLSPASDTQKLRWRSGIVEIYRIRNDSRETLKNSTEDATGTGFVVTPEGLIVGNLLHAEAYIANSDTQELHAKFDDGSFVKLTVVEDAGNGWLALKPEKELRSITSSR